MQPDSTTGIESAGDAHVTDQNQDGFEPNRPTTSAAVIVGVLLVAGGVALLLDRTSALPASWRQGIWPVLLIGYGIARLTEPRRRGREGLFFVLAGAWWLAGVAGWVSLVDTWPLLIVAAGASLVLQAVTASSSDPSELPRRFERRHGAFGWVLPLILLGAVLTSGVNRRIVDLSPPRDGELRAVTMMGQRTTRMPAAELKGGEVTTIMGENTIDFSQATVAPGSTITVKVFTLMGNSIVTVPEGWDVDVDVMPVMGDVTHRHQTRDWSSGEPPAGTASAPATAPHLVLRGTVIMGRLLVRS